MSEVIDDVVDGGEVIGDPVHEDGDADAGEEGGEHRPGEDGGGGSPASQH